MTNPVDYEGLIERLEGVYRIPIKDGLGPAGGDEPDNAKEFVRRFETPPIHHEAAAALRAILEREKVLEGALTGCSELFDEIRGDYSDPRHECREGQLVIRAALKGGNHE
jgi:hypothetical protein